MSTATLGTALHPQVAAARRKVGEFARRQFQVLFQSADDMLFAMAEQGAKDGSQGAYFDAMRHLRLKKTELVDGFVREFEAGFARALGLGAPAPAGKAAAPAGLSAALKLVDEHEMEEALAVTSLADRVNNACGDGLYALAQRFNHVLAGAQFDDQSLPVGSRVIGEAFRAALAVLGPDTTADIKLILYKLFDKCVARNLGEVYDEINADMANAGILPEIKVVIRKNANGGGPRAPRTGAATEDAAEEDDEAPMAASARRGAGTVPVEAAGSSAGGAGVAGGMFETLAQLLVNAGAAAGGGAGTAAGSGIVAAPGSVVPQEQATRSLVDTLSTLQHDAGGPGVAGALSGAALTGAIVSAIKELQANGSAAAPTVTQVDANTIDIVALLFEFVLDDNNIPGALRALISKLQLPYLKVALLDKEFFNNYAHPARRLLNELGQAGIGWRHGEDPLEDPLYKKVNAIVEKIVTGFESDVALFQTLLDDFLAFQAEDSAVGEAQELLIGRTKNDVKEVIEQKVAKQAIPAAVHEFLIGPWKEVLQAVHEKDGFKSDAWERTVQVADELIWSVQAKPSPESRARLVKMLPTLLRSLRTGLQSIHYDAAKIDAFLQSLQPLHLALLHGKLPDNLAAGKVSGLTLGTVLPDTGAEASDPAAAARAEAIAAVQQLATGDWVEFVKEHDDSVRGKLIWHSEVLDDYTFVNRMYKVVAERNSAQLVDEFIAGKARRLVSVPLIDRALDAVMKRLKR